MCITECQGERGRKDTYTYSNLSLTHLFCHQRIHSDNSNNRDKPEKLLLGATTDTELCNCDVSGLLEPCAMKACKHGSEGSEVR